MFSDFVNYGHECQVLAGLIQLSCFAWRFAYEIHIDLFTIAVLTISATRLYCDINVYNEAPCVRDDYVFSLTDM